MKEKLAVKFILVQSGGGGVVNNYNILNKNLYIFEEICIFGLFEYVTLNLCSLVAGLFFV